MPQMHWFDHLGLVYSKLMDQRPCSITTFPAAWSSVWRHLTWQEKMHLATYPQCHKGQYDWSPNNRTSLKWDLGSLCGLFNHVIVLLCVDAIVFPQKESVLFSTRLKNQTHRHMIPQRAHLAPHAHKAPSTLPTRFKLGGRATLGLIMSWSYCAVHLWRSHYNIHKLFKHVPALASLSHSSSLYNITA